MYLLAVLVPWKIYPPNRAFHKSGTIGQSLMSDAAGVANHVCVCVTAELGDYEEGVHDAGFVSEFHFTPM